MSEDLPTDGLTEEPAVRLDPGADEDSVRMTVSEHLDELRKRVIRALLYFTGGLVLCFIFGEEIIGFVIRQPQDVLREVYGADNAKLLVYGTTEGFFTYLKLCFAAGLLLSSPFVARELWGFVAEGLYPHEKKWVRLFAPISYLLFLGGVAFLYWFVLPTALKFLYTFGVFPGAMEMKPRYAEYVSIYITLSLVMGFVFQLPLVMLFLMATDLMAPGTFSKYRRHFIVGAVIVLAILTPTGDAPTLILCTLPVLALYEAGLLMGRFVRRRRQA